MLKTIRMRIIVMKKLADGRWLYLIQSDKLDANYEENDFLQA
jgi:hypothetical protein